ncbi:MAG TPA: ABC transporter permease, partial [Patescibacteria group bacterium]|nr:ABC transporter permease [Patescibacteria group bacterium]
MNITESVAIAFDAVRAHKIRSSLTLLSIAIGIFAIIGAGTAVTSLENAITGEMANLGENSIIITRTPNIEMGNTWRKYRKRKELTYSQAVEFKKRMESTDMVSIVNTTAGITIQSGNLSTNRDVSLIGCDEYYFSNNNIGVEEGRPFVAEDISLNRPVAVIGNDVVVKLFPNISPIGQEIRIKNKKFTVIGVLKQRGAMLGQSQDNLALVPISYFMRYFSSEWEASVTIMLRAYSRESLPETIDESIGIMRSLRNVKPWEENSFEVSTNETIAEQFAGFTGYLAIFGQLAGGFALLAAGIGIMNIMLVTVKERTREIGIRKAIGAQKNWILLQF